MLTKQRAEGSGTKHEEVSVVYWYLRAIQQLRVSEKHHPDVCFSAVYVVLGWQDPGAGCDHRSAVPRAPHCDETTLTVSRKAG